MTAQFLCCLKAVQISLWSIRVVLSPDPLMGVLPVGCTVYLCSYSAHGLGGQLFLLGNQFHVGGTIGSLSSTASRRLFLLSTCVLASPPISLQSNIQFLLLCRCFVVRPSSISYSLLLSRYGTDSKLLIVSWSKQRASYFDKKRQLGIENTQHLPELDISRAKK